MLKVKLSIYVENEDFEATLETWLRASLIHIRGANKVANFEIFNTTRKIDKNNTCLYYVNEKYKETNGVPPGQHLLYANFLDKIGGLKQVEKARHEAYKNKHSDNVAEIWREYYRAKNTNYLPECYGMVGYERTVKYTYGTPDSQDEYKLRAEFLQNVVNSHKVYGEIAAMFKAYPFDIENYNFDSTLIESLLFSGWAYYYAVNEGDIKWISLYWAKDEILEKCRCVKIYGKLVGSNKNKGRIKQK